MKDKVNLYELNPAWLKHWKRILRSQDEWVEGQSYSLRKMQYYIEKGEPHIEKGFETPPLEVKPPFRPWESAFLADELSTYGAMRLFVYERVAMQHNEVDLAAAHDAFFGNYLQQMVKLRLHHYAPTRIGRDLRVMNVLIFPFTALGVVLGCTDKALGLARAQIEAYRRGYYPRSQLSIMNFMWRLLADYLSEPIQVLDDHPETLPICQRLFEVWRQEDPAVIASACLDMCNLHTHRCMHNRDDSNDPDFRNNLWTRTPIEVLLLFKLRSLLGLANPQVEHPLMASPLFDFPEGVDCNPTGMLAEVHARMATDGFDEREILGFYGVQLGS
jgi:hypothetical protein